MGNWKMENQKPLEKMKKWKIEKWKELEKWKQWKIDKWNPGNLKTRTKYKCWKGKSTRNYFTNLSLC